MSTKFITTVLTTAALIAGLSAVPARASDKDAVAGVLFGAATLFMLSKIFDTYDDGHQSKKAHVPHTSSRQSKPAKARASDIPRKCVRDLGGRTRSGHRRVVASGRCLDRNYTGARRLPAQCRTGFWNKGKRREAFSLPCLRSRGFEVASRR